jgi:hypothetical protein
MRDGKPESKVKSEKYNTPPIHTGPSYKPLRLPFAPAMALAVRVPEGATPQADPELDELELLLDEDELLEDELEELLLEEELLELDELEELLLELELLEVPPALIIPAEAVSVTRSILEPSSRLRILSV